MCFKVHLSIYLHSYCPGGWFLKSLIHGMNFSKVFLNFSIFVYFSILPGYLNTYSLHVISNFFIVAGGYVTCILCDMFLVQCCYWLSSSSGLLVYFHFAHWWGAFSFPLTPVYSHYIYVLGIFFLLNTFIHCHLVQLFILLYFSVHDVFFWDVFPQFFS